MRVMDGLMAIPGVLLAIALVSLSGASRFTVIVAITVPEIPRVVRLVRAVVLTVREEPYVEAAIAAGTRLPLILIRHVLPNCVPALIVQATYVCASAMLTEAILSFLGAGTPPEIPSWGNMMAEGRAFFPIAPRIILFPGRARADDPRRQRARRRPARPARPQARTARVGHGRQARHRGARASPSACPRGADRVKRSRTSRSRSRRARSSASSANPAPASR